MSADAYRDLLVRTRCHHSFQGPEGNVMLTAIETRSVRNCVFPISHCETRKRRIAEMLLSDDDDGGENVWGRKKNCRKKNRKSVRRPSTAVLVSANVHNNNNNNNNIMTALRHKVTLFIHISHDIIV